MEDSLSALRYGTMSPIAAHLCHDHADGCFPMWCFRPKTSQKLPSATKLSQPSWPGILLFFSGLLSCLVPKLCSSSAANSDLSQSFISIKFSENHPTTCFPLIPYNLTFALPLKLPSWGSERPFSHCHMFLLQQKTLLTIFFSKLDFHTRVCVCCVVLCVARYLTHKQSKCSTAKLCPQLWLCIL